MQHDVNLCRIFFYKSSTNLIQDFVLYFFFFLLNLQCKDTWNSWLIHDVTVDSTVYGFVFFFFFVNSRWEKRGEKKFNFETQDRHFSSFQDLEHADVLTVGFNVDGVERVLDLRLNTDLIPVGYQQRHQHRGTYKVHTPSKVVSTLGTLRIRAVW